jgi:hypothetical protein
MIEYTPPPGFDIEAPFFEALVKDVNERKTTYVGGFDKEGKLHGGDRYRTLIQLSMNVMAYDTYAKTGMKLTRHWKPTNVKRYYGVKGNPTKVAAMLKELHETIIQTLAA